MILTIDTETTGATNGTKGNPFSDGNRLCYVGALYDSIYDDYSIEYSRQPCGARLRQINHKLVDSHIVVGFNLKFDTHWLRRYDVSVPKRVWDCQLVEFILENQQNAYPSLEATAAKYGLGTKLDVVKTEYWDKGVDTDQVPEEILRDYLKQDVMLTRAIYDRQQEIVKGLPYAKQVLISLANQDLLTLEECEWNGVYYNIEKSLAEAKALEERLEQIDKRLAEFWPDIPCNFNSGKHLSALLYGGVIKEDYREEYTFVYKDGKTAQKLRWAVRSHKPPALAQPLKNSELKPDKDGNKIYSTDIDTLKKLKVGKDGKKIIGLLLERSGLEQLKSMYFEGWPKIHQKMEWEDNIIHGQLNQVVATTGRLAAKKPNQQNMPDAVRVLVESRF